MAYLGKWKIDDYVPIPATTHRFSTGAAYAPTSLTYSIYEDATTTGLDEDVDMTPASPFDSIVGCYLARRQLTAAAGFEVGKNYTVVVKATVDSVAAITMHTFQIESTYTATLDTVKADTVEVLTRLPDATAGAAGGVFIAGSNAATTVDITGSLSGSVGSVTGAVGSVTGAVGSVAGNVDGSVASVTGAVGSVTGSVGSVTGAVGSVTGAVGSVTGNVGGIAGTITDFDELAAAVGTVSEVAEGVRDVAIAGAASSSVGAAIASLVTQIGTAGDGLTNIDLPDQTMDITGSISGSVGSVTALSAAAIDSILDEVVEGSYTLRQYLRIFASAMGAKVSGCESNAPVFRDTADSKDRITATTDQYGNRSAITLDAT